MQLTRGAVLRYFASLDRKCARALFMLRMPDKVEVRKYSDTVRFMQKFMVCRVSAMGEGCFFLCVRAPQIPFGCAE